MKVTGFLSRIIFLKIWNLAETLSFHYCQQLDPHSIVYSCTSRVIMVALFVDSIFMHTISILNPKDFRVFRLLLPCSWCKYLTHGCLCYQSNTMPLTLCNSGALCFAGSGSLYRTATHLPPTCGVYLPSFPHIYIRSRFVFKGIFINRSRE